LKIGNSDLAWREREKYRSIRSSIYRGGELRNTGVVVSVSVVVHELMTLFIAGMRMLLHIVSRQEEHTRKQEKMYLLYGLAARKGLETEDRSIGVAA
jgi:hypothetical protein